MGGGRGKPGQRGKWNNSIPTLLIAYWTVHLRVICDAKKPKQNIQSMSQANVHAFSTPLHRDLCDHLKSWRGRRKGRVNALIKPGRPVFWNGVFYVLIAIDQPYRLRKTVKTKPGPCRDCSNSKMAALTAHRQNYWKCKDAEYRKQKHPTYTAS